MDTLAHIETANLSNIFSQWLSAKKYDSKSFELKIDEMTSS